MEITMQNNTILIVDDTITNLDILNDLLEDYDVIDTTNGKDALEIVNEEKVDLILLDIMMPEMDGYEVCKKLKANPDTHDIPVIFITAKTDEDSIEKAYDVGGSDYISKPFKVKELLARVKRELKLQALQKELKLLASIDPMTQLYNRRHFANISQHYLSLAKRDNHEISIIMLDIDKFKNVNDTYGHQIGDEVIISLAQLLKKNIRKSDIVCRYGGEEFVVMLPNTKLDQARVVAEEIRKNTQDLRIPIETKKEINFTISLGVSSIHLDKENALEDALKRADDALYNAKELGRNRVCYKQKV
jgi:diguanylate cyclase (GGDEF)-like protein